MSVDWYGFHSKIDREATPEALWAALKDPEQAWWARRRLVALAAAGALTAAYNPLLHPKGKDGKWIERFGWVRWLDTGGKWRAGWVDSIDPTTGGITVKAGPNVRHFKDGSKLYARPKPKARLNLPNTITKEIPTGWTKTGSQGGSNPGGFFEVTAPIADDKWPELTSRSGLGHLSTQLATDHSVGHVLDLPDPDAIPPDTNVMVVPTIDSYSADRYDVVYKEGAKWFRVPNAPSAMTLSGGEMNPDLEVSADDVFGAAGSTRRFQVAKDPNTKTFELDPEYGPDELAKFVQGIATDKPKVGDKFYIKNMSDPMRVKNEKLANDFYELLGVPVPDVAISADGLTVSSKILGDKGKFDPNNKAHVKMAQDAFVADAWLANWDAVGMDYDNMMVDSDGRVWRVDAGGALLYRAMVKSGAKGNAFGDNVTELESLRNSSINPQAAKVYGKVSMDDLLQQAQVLRSISPQRIRDLVDANEMPDSLADRMIARRKSILDQLGVPDTTPDNHGAVPQPEVTPIAAIPDTVVSEMVLSEDEKSMLKHGIDPSKVAPLGPVFGKPGGPAQPGFYNPDTDQWQPIDQPPLAPKSVDVELEALLNEEQAIADSWKGKPSLGDTVKAHVEQMGSGPDIHVSNYDQAIGGIPKTTVSAQDWYDETFLEQSIFDVDGGMWVYDSDLDSATQPGVTSFRGLNLVTGEKDRISVTNNYHATYNLVNGEPATEQIVDQLKVGRELGNQEIVNKALASGKTIAEIAETGASQFTTSPSFKHYEFGLPFGQVQTAKDGGRLGPEEAPWPIRTNSGEVFDFVDVDPIQQTIKLKGLGADEEGYQPFTLTKAEYDNLGPWWRPGNDTTAAVVRAKGEQQNQKFMDSQAKVHNVDEKATIAAWDEYGYSGHDVAKDPKPKIFDKNDPDTWSLASDDEFNAAFPDGVPVETPDSYPAKPGDTDLDVPAGYQKVAADTVPSTSIYIPQDKVEAYFNGTWTPSNAKVGWNGKPLPTEPATPTPTVAPGQTLPNPNHLTQADFQKSIDIAKASNDKIALNAIHQTMTKMGIAFDNNKAANGKTTTNGLVSQLNPHGEVLLTTEISLDDIDSLQSLVGTNVVVLPTDYVDAPGNSNSLTTYNHGIGTVTQVKQDKVYIYGGNKGGVYVNGHYLDTVRISYKFADGSQGSVHASDDDDILNATYGEGKPKSIIPVESQLIPESTATLKQNGQVVVNGQVVGTWNNYDGMIIDGDHSLTGHPMVVGSTYKKELRLAALHYTVPIPIPVKKPKTTKVYLTENQINDLNAELGSLEIQMAMLSEQIEQAATAMPAGEGVPLNDGTFPVVGGWVFSTKDGAYAKVQALPSGKDPPDTLRVNIQKPDGTFLWTRRKRKDLVSAPGPGETPWVLQTKAVKSNEGGWIGPGSHGTVNGGAVIVLDTTTDGKIKFKASYGAVSWGTKDDFVADSGSTLKSPAGSVDVDALNAELAVLNDSKLVLAAEIAKGKAPPPKKKKPVGTPYPGPGGQTYKQPVAMRQEREANGQKNLKDDYAPTVGMIVRHNDGTQYVVSEVGDWDSSHKNAVRVLPIGTGASWYQAKWKQTSTLVVDHDAMMTSSTGNTLPVVTHITGHDNLNTKNLRFLWRQHMTGGYYAQPPGGGPKVYRPVGYDLWYVQDTNGALWNIGNGKKANGTDFSTLGEDGLQRIAVIDMDGDGDPYNGPDPQTLTMSMGLKKINSYGDDQPVYYAAVHAPTTDPGTLFGGKANISTAANPTPTPPSTPKTTDTGPLLPLTKTEYVVLDAGSQAGYVYNPSSGYWEQAATYNPATGKFDLHAGQGQQPIAAPTAPTGTPEPTDWKSYKNKPDSGVWDPVKGVWVAPSGATVTPDGTVTPAAPLLPPVPTPTPQVVNQPPPPPVSPSGNMPQDTLPLYVGQPLEGQQLPHQPTQKAGDVIQVYKPTGPADLTVALPGTRSVMAAVGDAVAETHANKGNGLFDGKWTAKWAMTDSDLIEDQMVHTQVVRDAQGVEYIDVQAQLTRKAAKAAHNTFMASSTGEVGDWDFDQKKPQGLTINDKVNVYVSKQGAEGFVGKLKPSKAGQVPNATITDGPTLVGKNAAGSYDVYRFEVVTASGDVGYIDMEDRGTPSVWVAMWNPTKPTTTNGKKGLNPLAQADGWSIRSNSLGYDMSSVVGELGSQQQVYGDGAKQLGDQVNAKVAGSGWVLQRDYQGAQITLETTDSRNALDGQFRIRVRADDPQAQKKISEAMQTIGIPKEKQAAPTKRDLQIMALNQIWVQYRDHYNVEEVSNATPEDPAQAFEAVDKALGLTGAPGLEKMSMNDVSLVVHPDGRVQVLLSERIADRLEKSNKVRYYDHAFYSGNSDEAVLGMVQGRTPGILSSNERFSKGLFFGGMSPKDDHPTNGARYTFTRAKRDSGGWANGGGVHAVMHPYAMHRQVGFYWRHRDKFGDRDPYTNTNFVTMPDMQPDNELMVRRSVETEIFDRIVLSASQRKKFLKMLHDRGVTHAPNGMLLEDFFVASKDYDGNGGFDPSMLTKPKFGDEIPLASIPDLPTAPTAPAPPTPPEIPAPAAGPVTPEAVPV